MKLVRWAARALLALLGWRAVLQPPPGPKAVIAFYPHTSNWDFLFGMLGRYAVDLPASFMAKDTIFWWPLGTLLRAMGGIAVNRRERTGAVAQMEAEFARRDRLLLALAPEGTRAQTGHLKSGFWHLALAAKVPLGLGYLDYGRREVGVGAWLTLSGDAEKDLAAMRAFYADKMARKPEQASEIRFREGAPDE